MKSRIETSNCELRLRFALARCKFVKKKLKTLCEMDFLNYLDDVPLWLAIPLVIINLVLWGLLIYLIWKIWSRHHND